MVGGFGRRESSAGEKAQKYEGESKHRSIGLALDGIFMAANVQWLRISLCIYASLSARENPLSAAHGLGNGYAGADDALRRLGRALKRRRQVTENIPETCHLQMESPCPYQKRVNCGANLRGITCTQ